MCIYDNASKIPKPKKAWMKNHEWPWFIPFCDAYSVCDPMFTIMSAFNKYNWRLMQWGVLSTQNNTYLNRFIFMDDGKPKGRNLSCNY